MAKHKVSIEKLQSEYEGIEYSELYKLILKRIEAGELQPVKNSGINGKKPALHNMYWLMQEKTDYSELMEELKYKINPALDVTFYEKNPSKYEKDRPWILMLSEYIHTNKDYLRHSETLNERSFEIFRREKFLRSEGGRELLKRVNYATDNLNYYDTSEPLSYYAHKKSVPQNFLIIENKDTFYSMRRHLIEGNDFVLGLEVGTLVYGGGKGIVKSFEDYINGVEPYFSCEENKVYYFGDLDYEGIQIYESLSERFNEDAVIRIFEPAYRRMFEKAEIMGLESMPQTKEGQKEKDGNLFFEQFSEELRKKMKHLLQGRKYIPQEILNANDY